MQLRNNKPLTAMGFATAALLILSNTTAQDLVHKAAPQRTPIMLYNGVIHTVSGATHKNGCILFTNGKIIDIAAGRESADLPVGTRSIDLRGSHVYPGLVTAHTTLGLTELDSVPMTTDTTELGDITSEVRANIAVNPDSTAIPVARSNGILTAGVFPSGGLIAGRGSAMATDGWTSQDMTLRAEVGPVLSWPRRKPEDSIRRLDEFFAKARAWHQAKAADPTIPTDLRLAAMGAALQRKSKVFIRANDLASIEAAVEWGVRNKLRLVIIGGRDAVLCAKLLLRHKVEVIISGTHSTPKRRDSHYNERFVLPRELHATGVSWCLGTDGNFSNERNLPYHAASAVAFGLAEDIAIKSITLFAARTLGVADRVGSLETGKDATLIITNGSPLDLTTVTETAFVQGRQVQLHNKHRALAAKYRAKYSQLRK